MLRFIHGPSHGWLMVPKPEYDASGYKASRFSFESPEYVYLEEDCDAAGYLDAAEIDYRDESKITDVHIVDETIVRQHPNMSGEGFISPFAKRN